MKVVDLVRACRERLDMNVTQFADWVGASGRQVRRWESGECRPSQKFLDEISRIYGDIGEEDGAPVSLEDAPRLDTRARAESALLAAISKARKARDIVALSAELRSWKERGLWK